MWQGSCLAIKELGLIDAPPPQKNMMFYLSRAFVEFGPFASPELTSFHQRGLLKDTDYVRAEGSDDWLHVNDWVAKAPTSKAAAAPKKAAPKKPKSAPAAPAPAVPAAKKAAVKKAKK
jgi:hypothetical protein